MASLLPPLSTVFKTVCQKGFVPAYDENDELLIQNLGAIKMGLLALIKEDASDWDEADKLWKRSIYFATQDAENEIGASAEGSITVEDSYYMEGFPIGV